MAIERKQSFGEIMASLDVPVELPAGAKRHPCPVLLSGEPDCVNLSLQAEKALPVRKPGQKTERKTAEEQLRQDSQGNKIRISLRGNILAESGAEEVAWETKLK